MGKLKFLKWFGLAGVGVIGILALIILVFAAVPFVFMLAWNAFMPAVFKLPQIDFWMALAAVILLSIIKGALSVKTETKRC